MLIVETVSVVGLVRLRMKTLSDGNDLDLRLRTSPKTNHAHCDNKHIKLAHNEEKLLMTKSN